MRPTRTSNIIVLIAVTILLLARGVDAEHKLGPEIREEVDALKSSAREQDTSPDNAVGRADTLWRWANAVAMEGEHLPINLPLLVGRVLNAQSPRSINRFFLRTLDRYIYELGLRDDQPDAIGTVTINAPDAIEARSHQTIEVTYTVGALPMREGGRIMLGRQIAIDSAALQSDDPAAEGYVSVRSSNPGAKWEPGTEPWIGPHGGFRAPTPLLTYRLAGTSLDPGDTITLTYGDRAGGSPGMQIQTFSNDGVGLPIYVDLEDVGHFLSLPIPTYRVLGTDVVAVHGIAPSIIAPGETFELSVRPEDYYFNLASGAIPEIEVTLNGEPYDSIAAGEAAISLLRISLDKPGVYRFGFASTDGRIRGQSNPIWVRENPPYRIYWGETHGHSGFAEGQGTVEGYFKFGRDEARLDFLTLSEHDIWMDDYEWQTINEATAEFGVEGKFIVFPGYEWSIARARGGHHNVFFRRAGHDRVSSHRAPVLSTLYQILREENSAEDVLIIPHAHQLGDWRMNDTGSERLIEIMSAHGTFEWFGQRYLEHGHRVGFVGASDDHIGHPGYAPGRGYDNKRSNLSQFGGLAAALAPEKTTDDIFDALRARSAYATSHSQRIILDLSFNGESMGQQLPYSDTVVIEGRVIGTKPIETIEVINNGKVAWSKRYTDHELSDNTFAKLSFGSESTSFIRDNPRGYRVWKGSLEVSGGKLIGFSMGEKLNRTVDFVRVNESNSNRIDFSVGTRGLVNGIVLAISGASKRTAVDVRLDETREAGRAPVQVRRPDTFPASETKFTLAEAARGEATRKFETDLFVDEMAMRIVDTSVSIDQSFRFEAPEPPMRGDYYYVRVRQLDGALAWSSPVWIGGEPPR